MSSMKLSTKLVKPHFSVVQKQEQKNLIDFILDELKSISVEELKLDPDFLKYISELIENDAFSNLFPSDLIVFDKISNSFKIKT